jgi:DNA-binding LacI/PurR family transcriptional regulator
VLLYGEQAARVAGSLGDLPAVLCTERVPGVRISQVLKDNREGAELATHRLLDLGHKWVVFMTHASRKRWAIERAKGYSAAMAEAGYPPVHCSSAGPADEVIDKLTQDVLEHGATAVVAGNDAIARRLIKRLERRGIDVPRDISVIGFDHAPVPDWDGPALATIDAQVERVAREAVHLLRASGRRLNMDPIIVTIPPLLIEGQTIARCRST